MYIISYEPMAHKRCEPTEGARTYTSTLRTLNIDTAMQYSTLTEPANRGHLARQRVDDSEGLGRGRRLPANGCVSSLRVDLKLDCTLFWQPDLGPVNLNFKP